MAVIRKSKRTGGPRTAAGKALASRNSLKTGVYSAAAQLPGESEKEFRALVADIARDFQAQGAIESMLSEKLAEICWKQRRLGKVENLMRLSALSRPVSLSEFESIGFWVPQDAAAFVDSRPQSVVEDAAWQRATRYLEESIRDRKFAEADLRDMESKMPDVYGLVADCARVIGLKDTSPKALANTTIGSEGNQAPILLHAFQDVLDCFNGRNWITEHQAELDMAKQRVRDQRMVDLILSDKTARASDYLSREFSRTLAELRKQQEWRRKTQVIDVTPEGETQ